jgi:hypothetical protein
MFSIKSGDFLNKPLSFDFNTAKRICLFFIFLTFRDLRMSNEPNILPHPLFGKSRTVRRKKINGECHVGQKRTHHMVHVPSHVVWANWCIVGPTTANYGLMEPS